MPLGTLGIIGYGTMGSAITSGLVKSKVYMPSDIHVYDIDAERTLKAKENGHFVHPTVKKLADAAGTLIIAVKPKDIEDVLHELKEVSDLELAISIVAGKSLKLIESFLGATPVVRVMPNTPAMVGAGACVVSRGSFVLAEHMEKANTIIGAIGFVTELPEMYMDAVTGLSGSGPAYVAMLIEALSDGGVKMGLPRQTALKLAAETVFGTAKMILMKDMQPSRLKDMVASPGGTTIAGIAALERGAFRGTVIDAVEAATLRSKELGLS